MKEKKKTPVKKNKKIEDLSFNTVDSMDHFLTTNQGLRINDNQNSLKAGVRGPTLLEDFIFRENIYDIKSCLFNG